MANELHTIKLGNTSYPLRPFKMTTEGDNRTVATSPNDYANEFIFRGLKTNSSFGSPSSDNYSYVFGLRGWSDSSGGESHELAFNNSGLFRRQGETTTWGAWCHILDNSNWNSYITPASLGVYTKTQTDTNISSAINGLVNGAPGALDTLNELAAALGDDANFAATVTNSLATKFDKAGGIITGTTRISRNDASADTMYYAQRTDMSTEIGFGIGTSSNRGIYDAAAGGWILKVDTNNNVTFSGKASTAGAADTAVKFASNATVKLTGDVTGEVSSQKGWTIATTLANSGVTAGSYGQSANATATHSGTFSVPYITVDAKGRVTAASTKTITLPSDNDTKNTTGTTNKTATKLFLAGATSQATAPVTYSNSGCYIGTDNCLYSNGSKVLTSYTNTTYSAGTGLSLSGTTFNHSNSVTAVTTAGLYKVKYDAQGHITGTSAITKSDITGLGIPGSDTNTTYSAGTGLSLSGTTFSHADTNTNISADTSYGPTADVTQSAKNTATFKVPQITLDGFGHVKSVTERTIIVTDTDTDTNTDTKNTTGTTNKTATKLFLAGATSQAANPKTYSNSGCYIGTDNCLYSNGSKVLTSYTNTTYSAGTGLSLSGTTFNHSNSVTAVTTAGLYKVKYDAQGHITGTTAITKDDITGLGIPGSDNDTKNTAGADNTTSKIFLVGPTAQTSSNGSARTYSQSNVYAHDNGLYADYIFVNDLNSFKFSDGVSIYDTFQLYAKNSDIPTNVSQLNNDSGYISSYNDTKNTTGTTNKTATKLFLAGATSQATAPTTYSNSGCYIGTDNCLYSNGSKVLTSYTDTKVSVTLATTSKAYLLATKSTPTSTATGRTAVSDTGVYLTTEAGGLQATKMYATSGFFEATYSSSDEKLKNFSDDIEVDFDKLAKLRKKYFTWKDKGDKQQLGVSAQEVKEIYPELVTENTETGYLSVDYAKLSVVALAAVDKLVDKQKELEDRLSKLEAIIFQ